MKSFLIKGATEAGLFTPLWFVALVVVQAALNPGYSHVALPISALAAFDTGWIQNLNFYISGALLAAFTAALHLGIKPTGGAGLIGVVLLLISSAGLAIAASFPWVMINGVPHETPQHVFGAITTFVGASTGLIVLSRRLRADSAWADLSSYVLSTGCAMLLLFVILGAFSIDEGTPLHAWAGLLQRVVVFIWFSCLAVLSLRLRRVVRAATMVP